MRQAVNGILYPVLSIEFRSVSMDPLIKYESD